MVTVEAAVAESSTAEAPTMPASQQAVAVEAIEELPSAAEPTDKASAISPPPHPRFPFPAHQPAPAVSAVEASINRMCKRPLCILVAWTISVLSTLFRLKVIEQVVEEEMMVEVTDIALLATMLSVIAGADTVDTRRLDHSPLIRKFAILEAITLAVTLIETLVAQAEAAVVVLVEAAVAPATQEETKPVNATAETVAVEGETVDPMLENAVLVVMVRRCLVNKLHYSINNTNNLLC